MTKEKQDMKLEKVDDKTAYENLLVKYAELENKIADIKANCDLAIEGRDIKIKELEQQIEKMKNCNNCKGYYTDQCLGCEDYCNWELKEIKKKDEEKLFTTKELVEQLVKIVEEPNSVSRGWYLIVIAEAKQFLKEIEK